tara:strand:- start:50 stop:505 length:456 start_codon:yes stop_codon:yes gene_type:complete
MIPMTPSRRDYRFAEMAALQAKRSNCLMQHGCVAVKNGRIFGRGYNNYRTRSKDGFIQNCMTCHAEMSALREVNKLNIDFKKISLYIVRVDNNNCLKSSAPCVDCMKHILRLKIKRIIYSNGNGELTVQNPNLYKIIHKTTGRRILNNKFK